MSFLDRFELLDLMQEGDVQTFRARERSTGRAVVVHFASSPEMLPGLGSAMDRGSHEGKFYVVTMATSLDSAGAWRVKPSTAQSTAPSAPPAQPAVPAASTEPGEFTRMFQLRQAPEPVAMPASKPVDRSPAAASQPGQFTRAFQRPVSAPSVAPVGAQVAGQPGEFTRMFQTPSAPPAPASAVPEPVPSVPEPAAQPIEAGTVAPRRISIGLIVVIVAVLSVIAVFILWRKLY